MKKALLEIVEERIKEIRLKLMTVSESSQKRVLEDMLDVNLRILQGLKEKPKTYLQ